jgi:hypothetical protein
MFCNEGCTELEHRYKDQQANQSKFEIAELKNRVVRYVVI